MSILDRPSMSEARRAGLGTAALLGCAILYGVSYVIANDVVAVSIYGDYSRIDQAISELSAKGAPSRAFLVAMSAVWSPCLVAFGIGVWRCAGENRLLRMAGAVFAIHGVIALLWLPFPMTARADVVIGAPMPVNDVGHITMSAVTGIFVITEIALTAAGLGRRFRWYSVATALAVIVFGAVLTGRLATRLPHGDATPWWGFYERVGIGAWMLWMAVLAVVLIRRDRTTVPHRDQPS